MSDKPVSTCTRCDTQEPPEPVGRGYYFCRCCSKLFTPAKEQPAGEVKSHTLGT